MKPTIEAARQLLKPDAFLFDLDGTLYRGSERIEGADRLIEKLARLRLPCWFVTNNSTRTPEEVAEHLRHLGIDADKGRVVTSAMAAAYYVKNRYPNADTFVIGERGLHEALREAGMRILQDRDDKANAEIVVQGLDRNLTYERLRLGINHLLAGASFVQTNPDRLLPMEGSFLPGAGTIGAALEAATGIKPVVIGKPSSILMDYALELAGTSSERTWVIGDNPHTDIAAGNNAGCPSILVLTGYCSADSWQRECESAGASPHAVCGNLDDLEQLIDGISAS
ncbi:HAD-IIA family hydrolase [Cohnella panacarvi]|uniref:HAD-IIA family hydrolase n=1 Tax=Cohnella panacarvi TaxID=400776 RepID=UPI00047AC55C|nr:HAD-IIA family hydrolase [Cohnella panacarvi]